MKRPAERVFLKRLAPGVDEGTRELGLAFRRAPGPSTEKIHGTANTGQYLPREVERSRFELDPPPRVQRHLDGVARRPDAKVKRAPFQVAPRFRTSVHRPELTEKGAFVRQVDPRSRMEARHRLHDPFLLGDERGTPEARGHGAVRGSEQTRRARAPK